MAIYPGKTPGTWRVVVWAPRAPGEPSRSNEKIVPGKKSDAKQFEARWTIELRASQRTEYRVAPTFAAFSSEKFQPYIKTRIRENTWKNTYRWRLIALSDLLGHLRITDIGKADAETYQREREACAETINGEVMLLGQILRYARESHGLDTKEFEVRSLSVGESRRSAWTDEQIAAVLATAGRLSPWLAPIIVFGLNTGMRPGEIVACEWSWIDRPARMVRVPSNDAWRPKNGKAREIPMSDAVADMLAGELPRAHERWVFPSRDGGRHAEFPDEAFARTVKEAKVPGSPHWMRHSFASHFLRNLPDMPLLADIMGHSSAYVSEIYRHMLPDHLARGRNAVNIRL